MNRVAPVLLITIIVLLTPSWSIDCSREDGWKVPLRIAVLYDSRSTVSMVASRYVKWIFHTMWRVPVDLIDTGRLTLSRDLFFQGSTPRYTLLFLTSIMDGRDWLPELSWRVLADQVDQVIPMVTGLQAVKVPQASELFGCGNPRDVYVDLAEVEDSPLTENLSKRIVVHGRAVVATLNGGKSLVWSSKDGPGRGALLVVKGLNLWFGFSDFLQPMFLTGSLTMVLSNVLKISPWGFVRVKPSRIFVALRVDDVPLTTESWVHGWRHLSAEGWRKFFRVLEKHGAKCSLLVVPYNVSKEGGLLTPYNLTHGDILEVLREAVNRGIAEVGCHGATHVNPVLEYFLRSDGDAWKLTKAMRFEFGYNPHTGQPFPEELERRHLELSTMTIEEWFGLKPTLFTPPWHVWSTLTELILMDIGYRFISADLRFYADGVRPPCVMGERSEAGLMCVPATHDMDRLILNLEALPGMLKPHAETRLPIVFLSHGRNWSMPTDRGLIEFRFSILDVDRLLTMLDEALDPEYVTLTELGGFLEAWGGVKLEALMEEETITLNLTSDVKVPVMIEVWRGGFRISQVLVDGKSVEHGVSWMELPNLKGVRQITIKLSREEEPFIQHWTVVAAFLAASCGLAVYIFLIRRGRRNS